MPNIIILYFHFFALVLRLSAPLSSATQPQNLAESGEWSVLTLGFPLPKLLRAGYSMKLIINSNIIKLKNLLY